MMKTFTRRKIPINGQWLIGVCVLIVLTVSFLSHPEVIGKNILQTATAWADAYSIDPDHPGPDQTDIDLMQNL